MRSSISTKGAIDCDIHPSVPNIEALLPYLNDHWRDTISQRGVHDLQTIAYPKNAPTNSQTRLETRIGNACNRCGCRLNPSVRCVPK